VFSLAAALRRLSWLTLSSFVLAACGVGDREFGNPGGEGGDEKPGQGGGSGIVGNNGGSGGSGDLGQPGNGPVLSVEPGALSIGPALVDQQASGVLTVKNLGDLPLPPPAFTLSGADLDVFAVTSNGCAQPLVAGASCSVSVRFSPKRPGAHTASLAIGGDAGGSASVALTGNAITPGALSISVGGGGTDQLGDVVLGEARDVQLSVTNTGDVDSGPITLTVNGPGFELLPPLPGGCESGVTALAASAACDFAVRFAPEVRGPASAAVAVSSEAAGDNAINLSGNGLSAAGISLQVAAGGSLDFGGVAVGGEKAQAFVLTNAGDVASGPIDIALTPGAWRVDLGAPGACVAGASLAPQATCSISVVFAPVVRGALNTTLSANAAQGSASLELTGVGLEPGSLVIAAEVGAADFGGVVLGEEGLATFRVTNLGDVDSGVLDVTLASAGFSALAPVGTDCIPGATSLRGGQSCTVRVRFLPGARGAAAGSLVIDSANAGNAALSLLGSGLLPAALTANQAQFDFGNVEVGVTAQPFNWVITNTGDVASGPLTFGNSSTDFLVTNGCAGGIAAGASCTVAVRFAAQSGLRSTTVSLSNGDTSASLVARGTGQFRLTVQVTGTGSVRSIANGITNCTTACSGLFTPGSVALVASTANGSNSMFESWSEATCTGPSTECAVALNASKTVSVRFAAVTNNLVFVASGTHPVTLGSAAAYDRVCNERATAAGINNAAGTGYIAIMSDSTASLRQRLGTSARGWVRMDRRPFGDTQAQIFAAANSQLIYHPVFFDERGRSAAEVSPMTGSNRDGTTGTNTCNNWTSDAATDSVIGGRASGGPGLWLLAFSTSACSAGPRPIMCMGNTRTAALPAALLAPVTGKRFWVSQNPVNIAGGQTPDQACNATRPAGVAANARAFVAYSTQPAASVIVPTANYVRPDGLLIGTGAQILQMQALAGPWLRADSSVLLGTGMWGGAPTPNDVATENCLDWRSTTARGLVGDYALTSQRFWYTFAIGSCADERNVYCVEP
jgi:hypothetical protein